VRVLFIDHAAAGSHYLICDRMTDDCLRSLSGIYFISLKTSEYAQNRAFTLIRQSPLHLPVSLSLSLRSDAALFGDVVKPAGIDDLQDGAVSEASAPDVKDK